MKRVIRRSVFETNSSSMHSIVVMKDNVRTDFDYYNDVYLWNGKLSLDYDDLSFGRSPFTILCNAKDKYSYALASQVGNNSYGHINDDDSIDGHLTKLINKYIELAKTIFIGCTGVDFPLEYNNKLFFGAVDHESAFLLDRFLEKENIDLKEFITNPKYVVVIDGDEYCVFNTMKSVGMISRDNIDKEFSGNNCFYEYIGRKMEDEKND